MRAYKPVRDSFINEADVLNSLGARDNGQYVLLAPRR